MVWLPDLDQDKGNHEHSGEHETENHAPFAPLEAVSLKGSNESERGQKDSLDTWIRPTAAPDTNIRLRAEAQRSPRD